MNTSGNDVAKDVEETDEFSEFRNEWEAVVSRLIARAWVDPEFKAALITDSTEFLHAEGLMFPDRYDVEFYDDPSADLGDWHTLGRGNRAIHRFPIPPVPNVDQVSSEPLGNVDGSALACCCPCASCTGAVSHETWS